MTTQAEALKSAEPATVRELIARLRQGDADAQIAADLLETRAPAVQQAPPMDAWIGHAKQSGLLNEDGVATDPHKTQTAWFAFTAAWNLAAAHPQAAQPKGKE